MKNLGHLIYIYIIALALSLIGWWLDSDITTNSFGFQMVEVFMLSLILFGILSVIYFLFLFLHLSIKGLLNK